MLEPGARSGVVTAGQPPLFPRLPGVLGKHTQQRPGSSNDGLKLLGWQRPVVLGYDVAQLGDGEMLHRRTAGMVGQCWGAWLAS